MLHTYYAGALNFKQFRELLVCPHVPAWDSVLAAHDPDFDSPTLEGLSHTHIHTHTYAHTHTHTQTHTHAHTHTHTCVGHRLGRSRSRFRFSYS